MAFIETLATLPTKATQAEAQGFLTRMDRSKMQLLWVLAQVAEEETTQPDDELLTALNRAKEHWDAIHTAENVSTATTAHIATFGTAIGEAIEEWPNWDRKTRVRNLTTLAQKGVQSIDTLLDLELVGIRNSDGGRNF